MWSNLPKKKSSSVRIDKKGAPFSMYDFAISMWLKLFLRMPAEGLAFLISAIIESSPPISLSFNLALKSM